MGTEVSIDEVREGVDKFSKFELYSRTGLFDTENSALFDKDSKGNWTKFTRAKSEEPITRITGDIAIALDIALKQKIQEHDKKIKNNSKG